MKAWRRQASGIPDPGYRALALEKLSKECLNPEAAAFFAVLAPRNSRTRVVRLIVAYQILYDYLDALNEHPDFIDLRHGLRLHLALIDAVMPGAIPRNYRDPSALTEDDDYLTTLVRFCQDLLQGLPATAGITPAIVRAARRCGEGQSHNHAVTDGHDSLKIWSNNQAPSDGYCWWELAAAGISCLAIHALFAAAADERSTLRSAVDIDAAYFPPICAISALLDSLIDYPDDARTGNHSFVAHYPSNTDAAERFAHIIGEAKARFSSLGHPRRHSVILAGIVSFYLSAPEAATAFAAPVATSAISATGGLTTLMLAVMRWRHRLHGWRSQSGPWSFSSR